MKSSCSINPHSPKQFSLTPSSDESAVCFLQFIDSEMRNLFNVASGQDYLAHMEVHGLSLGPDNIKVSVDVPSYKKAPLPIPTFKEKSIEDTVRVLKDGLESC